MGTDETFHDRNEMGYGAQADKHDESRIASGLSELSEIAWNHQRNQRSTNFNLCYEKAMKDSNKECNGGVEESEEERSCCDEKGNEDESWTCFFSLCVHQQNINFRNFLTVELTAIMIDHITSTVLLDLGLLRPGG